MEALRSEMVDLAGKVDGSLGALKQHRTEIGQALDHGRDSIPSCGRRPGEPWSPLKVKMQGRMN